MCMFYSSRRFHFAYIFGVCSWNWESGALKGLNTTPDLSSSSCHACELSRLPRIWTKQAVRQQAQRWSQQMHPAQLKIKPARRGLWLLKCTSFSHSLFFRGTMSFSKHKLIRAWCQRLTFFCFNVRPNVRSHNVNRFYFRAEQRNFQRISLKLKKQ